MKLNHISFALLNLGVLGAAQAQDGVATLPAVVVESVSEHLAQALRQEALRPVVIYGKEEIERIQGLTVGDVLRTLPGVTFTGPPGQVKDIRMLGMDKGYTEILLDGERVGGGGKERQIQVDRIPTTMIERIEIQRSPLAGEDGRGIAGTINIVLKRDAHNRSNLNLGVGASNGENRISAGANASRQLSENVNLQLGLNASNRHDLKDKSKQLSEWEANGKPSKLERENEVEDSYVKERNALLGLNWQASERDKISLRAHLIDTDENKSKVLSKEAVPKVGAFDPSKPYIANGSNREIEQKQRDMKRVSLAWERLLNQGQLELRASYQTGGEDKDKQALSTDAKGKQKATQELSRQHEDNHSLRLKWAHKEIAGHNLELGARYERSDRDDSKSNYEDGVFKPGKESDIFNLSEQNLALWVQDAWQISDAHILTLGVRGERNRTESVDGHGVGSEGQFTAINPSLHYQWRLAEAIRARASIARTSKLPKFDELSNVITGSTGPNTPLNPDKTGNPALKPESSWGSNLALEYIQDGMLLSVNVFDKRIDDLVIKRIELLGGRWTERPENSVDTAKLYGWGLEAVLPVRWISGLTVRGNYSRFLSKVLDSKTGQTVPFKDQQPWVANAGFDWKLPFWGVKIGSNFTYLAERPASSLQANAETAQKLLDAYIGMPVAKGWEARLYGSNLLKADKQKLNQTWHGNGQLKSETRELETSYRSWLLTLNGNF